MKALLKRRRHLLTVLAVLAASCDLPGRPDRDDRPKPANRVKDFGTLYATRCAGCHGADGNLGPAPPLNDPIFLAIVPDAELRRVITEGRVVHLAPKKALPAGAASTVGLPGAPLGQGPLLAAAAPDPGLTRKTLMPAFAHAQGGPLTAAQVAVLAGGIKEHWGPAAPPAGPLPPYLAPAGAGGDKDRGTRVFAGACAMCHGDQGQGGEVAGAVNDAAFLALISDQALRRIVITGRPDLGMPAYDDRNGRGPSFRPLTSRQIDDLVALLAYWRQAGLDNR
jgi:mono/diheme cytochrome c family protein